MLLVFLKIETCIALIQLMVAFSSQIQETRGFTYVSWHTTPELHAQPEDFCFNLLVLCGKGLGCIPWGTWGSRGWGTHHSVLMEVDEVSLKDLCHLSPGAVTHAAGLAAVFLPLYFVPLVWDMVLLVWVGTQCVHLVGPQTQRVPLDPVFQILGLKLASTLSAELLLFN